MAIQVRRGLEADFDPTKMRPGEWAVTLDADTKKQIVRMCFKAGVVKRLGTYEDFKAQIKEATAEIKGEYLTEFEAILEQVETFAGQTSANTETVITIRDEVVNTYFPQIIQNANTASTASVTAKSYAVGGTGRRNGEETDNSKYYSERSAASSSTAQAYAEQAEQAGNEAVGRIEEALAQNVPQFVMDFTMGHLKYQGGRFDFKVNGPTGHLLWEVAV